MPRSVLDAIRSGHWDYEPPETQQEEFASTGALPGSDEKLNILAERVRQGLPLWHPHDRLNCVGLFVTKPDETE